MVGKRVCFWVFCALSTASLSTFAVGLNSEAIPAKKKQFAERLPQTLVIKINNLTSEAEVLHLDQMMNPAQIKINSLAKEKFRPIKQSASSDIASVVDSSEPEPARYMWQFSYLRIESEMETKYLPQYYYSGYNYYYKKFHQRVHGDAEYIFYRWRYN